MANLRKLTLSVDEKVIERARRYSRRNRTSISRLVTNFLAGLGAGEGRERRYSHAVERLRGMLPADASEDEHRSHLQKKHRR